MDPYKAPGPNGYQTLFFQKFWNFTGSKLTQLALDVLNGRSLPA